MHIVTEQLTARKRHVCQCCGGRIMPGTRYLAQSGIDHGAAWLERFCLPCHTLADAAWNGVHDGDFWPDELGLWELRDQLRYSSDPILADLTSDTVWTSHPMPEQLCDRIRAAAREVL